MNINFAFLRHGYGCHNAMSNLVSSGVVSRNNAMKFLKTDTEKSNVKNILNNQDILPLNDPVLTNVGVDASVYNGCIVNKILKSLHTKVQDQRLQLDTFNVVGCSPLIRCMETSYYMTRKWKNPPDQIYVFPLLREIDESSKDKYSQQSREIIRITPSYSIKTIQEQKDYLKSIGILKYFNFTFVEAFPAERIEPGDVVQFLQWFGRYFIDSMKNPSKNLNVFVTTHAGVLRDYSKEGFYNNSGFVINTTYDNRQYSLNRYVSLNNFITEYNFFKDYSNPSYNSTEYYCPSNRCGQLCSVALGPRPREIKSVSLYCEETEEVPLNRYRKIIKGQRKQIKQTEEDEMDPWEWD